MVLYINDLHFKFRKYTAMTTQILDNLKSGSSLNDMNDHEVHLILKGACYELAPLTIPLCCMVFAQNIVIFADFYRERAKFVPSLFMGIAVTDILKAQGELIVSLVSIFVFTGYLEISALYYTMFYYMLTATPGINCSKLINLVLTITFTLNVTNPFRRLNTARTRKITAYLCLLITILHILDTAAAIVIHLKYLNSRTRPGISSVSYLWMAVMAMMPGTITVTGLFCIPDHTGSSRCAEIGHKHHLSHEQVTILGCLTGSLYFLVPYVITLVCMVIQIIYFRRSFQDDGQANSSTLNPTRHISITVLLVSFLSFTCHASFFMIGAIFFSIHPNVSTEGPHDDQFFVRMGVLLGFAEYQLPLIYAFIYPIIIITRKQELRERYAGYIRRITACCGSRGDTDRVEVDTDRVEVDTARVEVDTARVEVDTARVEVDTARVEVDQE